MKICIVIVLYNCQIEDSKTIKSLLLNFANNTIALSDFKIVIYDNSLTEQTIPDGKLPNCKYFHNPNNEGLAVAYNFALKVSKEESCDWLLLLDQDSSLPKDFIIALFKNLRSISKYPNIFAVVPKMCYNGHFFSPSKVIFGGIHRPINMQTSGLCPFEVFAIGSGSALKISFFQKIGGFNDFFWLDCLDRWIYYVINKYGGKVFITDIIIEHELSVMDYSKFVDEKRYSNIMTYETYFMQLYKSKLENLVYYFRLIKRIISFSLKKETQKYSHMTLKHLIFILFFSKEKVNGLRAQLNQVKND